MSSQRIERAYSLLSIKSIDEDERVITGIATTPTADRVGDIVEPKGAEFKLPIPLLWQHDSDSPVGWVEKAKVTAEGILVTCRFHKETEEGDLKQFLDRAWQQVRSKLVAGFSIGFKSLEQSRLGETWSYRYLRWMWLELSCVTIPANADATIQTVKQFDTKRPAASGTRRAVSPSTPGASGIQRKGSASMTKTPSEQIAEQQALLTTKSTRLTELMADQDTNGGLEAAEEKELADLTTEVNGITKKIGTLSALEAAAAAQATAVVATPATLKGAPSRSESGITVKELPKGTLFTRYAMAKAAGRGSLSDTIEYAKRFSNTPELVQFIKAEAGTAVVQSPGWGGELVNPDTMMTEFVELLRPQTIIGRVQGFRKTPFNIPIITQTGGSTFGWVGEAAPKPVGELAFERTTLSNSKVAGIIVMSDELVRLSTPSAESTVRQDMVDGCAQFLDQQFIRVAIAPGASNPASITYGVDSPAATGTTAAALRHDLNIALANFDSNGVATDGLVIVMTPALARGISLLTTSLGVAEFPGMTPTGGTLLGYPVIVSASVDSGTIVIFKPSEILLADDGRVTIDASREATLDMAGGSTPTFGLWQNNCVALRAEQWIRWQKRRALGTVAVIDGAAYAPA